MGRGNHLTPKLRGVFPGSLGSFFQMRGPVQCTGEFYSQIAIFGLLFHLPIPQPPDNVTRCSFLTKNHDSYNAQAILCPPSSSSFSLTRSLPLSRLSPSLSLRTLSLVTRAAWHDPGYVKAQGVLTLLALLALLAGRMLCKTKGPLDQCWCRLTTSNVS